jgi:hypothetical protein
MLPDFISHRVLPLLGAERAVLPEFSGGFNVSSTFRRSYQYFGWIGALGLFHVTHGVYAALPGADFQISVLRTLSSSAQHADRV